MCFELQMQAGLVTQMLNALYKALFTVSLHNLLGTQADMGCHIWCATKDICGQYVDAWLAQTAGYVDADRIFINVARVAKLDQTPVVQYAYMGCHCHCFDMVMGHIKHRRAGIGLNAL